MYRRRLERITSFRTYSFSERLLGEDNALFLPLRESVELVFVGELCELSWVPYDVLAGQFLDFALEPLLILRVRPRRFRAVFHMVRHNLVGSGDEPEAIAIAAARVRLEESFDVSGCGS